MDNQWIRSTTVDTFQQDVIEQSAECPVVVDFWAEWCQPCQQLMPILDELTTEFAGRFILVKIDVDKEPQLAQAFGVQGIPFVVAMVDGQPVTKLPGVMPKPQIKEWLETFIPSPAVEAFNAATAAEQAEDYETAETHYRTAVEADGETAAFRIGLARVLLQLDRELECQEMIDALAERGFLEPEAEAIKEQLELRSQVEDSGGTAAARAALEANPGDIGLTIQLAEALSVDKRYPEACDMLLEVIRSDHSELREKAKDAMVAILGAMGPKSKAASDYRRKLATAFY